MGIGGCSAFGEAALVPLSDARIKPNLRASFVSFPRPSPPPGGPRLRTPRLPELLRQLRAGLRAQAAIAPERGGGCLRDPERATNLIRRPPSRIKPRRWNYLPTGIKLFSGPGSSKLFLPYVKVRVNYTSVTSCVPRSFDVVIRHDVERCLARKSTSRESCQRGCFPSIPAFQGGWDERARTSCLFRKYTVPTDPLCSLCWWWKTMI